MHYKGTLKYENTYLRAEDGENIADPCLSQTHDPAHGDPDENAARLAACWNACQGIPTEALNAGLVTKLVGAYQLGDWIQDDFDAAKLTDEIPGQLAGGYDQWNAYCDAMQAVRALIGVRPRDPDPEHEPLEEEDGEDSGLAE